ncbi:MAG TPA: hypothetical protein VIV88_00795 [Gemmatimonadales bacterium]
MLSREYLRERTDDYRNALQNRGATADLERFLELAPGDATVETIREHLVEVCRLAAQIQ